MSQDRRATDWAAVYRGSLYAFRAEDGAWRRCTLDGDAGGLAGLLEPVALVTAWNPGSREQPEEQNRAANRRLAEELVRSGVRHGAAFGASLPGVTPAWREEGFALFGLTPEQARSWGRACGQRAVVWLEARRAALLFCDGSPDAPSGARELPEDETGSAALSEPVALRPARDGDAAAVIALIGACYAEYPGNVLDVEREERGLLAPATSFERFWVLEAAGSPIGCVAAATRVPRLRVELKKCYLAAAWRGRGLGRRLIAAVEEYAHATGCREVELWSDTRFVAGHRAYLGCGYRRSGAVRELHDLSRSVEWHFRKDLAGPGGGAG